MVHMGDFDNDGWINQLRLYDLEFLTRYLKHCHLKRSKRQKSAGSRLSWKGTKDQKWICYVTLLVPLHDVVEKKTTVILDRDLIEWYDIVITIQIFFFTPKRRWELREKVTDMKSKEKNMAYGLQLNLNFGPFRKEFKTTIIFDLLICLSFLKSVLNFIF